MPFNRFSRLPGTLFALILIASFILSACGTTAPIAPVTPNVDLPTFTPLPPTATPEPTLPPPTATPDVPPTPNATEVPALGNKVSAKDGMDQIFIPAGDFLMGAGKEDHEAKQDLTGGVAFPEVPQFTYTLPDYWIDKTEVTNAMFAKCVAEGGCAEKERKLSYTINDYYGNPEYDNYPVIYVKWYGASDYCKWAGRRLPTEAEWEKAARGTAGIRYPWGDEPITSDKANLCDKNCNRPKIANPSFDDGYGDLAPVGSYPAGASPYGVLDMSGNAWEWTSTLAKPYPYDATDGREDQDVTGKRVWRGGSFLNGVWWMRSSMRYLSVQYYEMYMLGFRCAESVP